MTPITRMTKFSSTPRSTLNVCVWHLLMLSLNKTKQNIGKYLHKFNRQSWQASFPSFSPCFSHFLPIFAFYFDLFFIHKTNVRNVREITLKRLNWHAQRVGGTGRSLCYFAGEIEHGNGDWGEWVPPMNTQVEWVPRVRVLTDQFSMAGEGDSAGDQQEGQRK